MATAALPPVHKPLRLLAELNGQIIGAIDAGEIAVPLTVDGAVETAAHLGEVRIGIDNDALREELHDALRRVVADLDAAARGEVPDGQ